MNELQVFYYENNEIRTILKDDEPWWVLADVCQVLEHSNSRMVAERLDEDEKGVSQIYTLGGNQKMTVINESGLYKVILRSDKPEAKKFTKWVTSEVLPSIRKHGAYMTPPTIESLLDDPDMLIRLATTLKEERMKRKALETENAQQRQQIAELNPKASYYDVVLQTKDVISTSQIAKDYGKSAFWLNEYLHKKGIQFKQGNIWLLYQKYAEQGYTKSKTHTYSGNDGEQHSKLHTYWTQKGRLFIYGLLKSDSILPLIESEAA